MRQVAGVTKEQILYEDQDIIVCEKQAGVPVQSGKFGQIDMETALRNYFSLNRDLEQTAQTKGEKRISRDIPYVGIIHRLDQPVEGIVVFAKNPKAAKSLSNQIAKGQMEKRYRAVVVLDNSVLKKDTVTLCDYLLKDGRSNTSKVVEKGCADAKLSKLSYTIMEVKDTLALVDIELGTGRHHQIRVQMAHQHLPLWGDTKYNPQAKQESWQQIALCAYKLCFFHPSTNKKLQFVIAPKGQIFQGFSAKV